MHNRWPLFVLAFRSGGWWHWCVDCCVKTQLHFTNGNVYVSDFGLRADSCWYSRRNWKLARLWRRHVRESMCSSRGEFFFYCIFTVFFFFFCFNFSETLKIIPSAWFKKHICSIPDMNYSILLTWLKSLLLCSDNFYHMYWFILRLFFSFTFPLSYVSIFSKFLFFSFKVSSPSSSSVKSYVLEIEEFFKEDSFMLCFIDSFNWEKVNWTMEIEINVTSEGENIILLFSYLVI